MNKKIVFLLLLGLAIVGGGWYWTSFTFDADKIIRNSQLGKRTFSTPVEEVVSPQHHLKAYLLEDKSNPIISISFIFANAGARAEQEGQYGMAKIAADLMTEGAGEWDSQEYKEMLENYAISIRLGADGDDMSGQLLTTKEFAPIAFEMLQKTLTSPRIERQYVNRTKAQVLAAIKRQQENPEQQLSLAANKDLFAPHPYGRNPLGEPNDINNFSPTQIRTYVRKNLGQSNLIVGIAGDISATEAGQLLDDIFGQLPENGAKDNVSEADLRLDGQISFQEADIAQNIAFIAAKGTKRNAEDFYPLYIANYILGGSGLTSRLNQIAREKQGLTYGIYTGLSIADKAEMITGGFAATAQNFDTVIDIFTKEWKNIGTNGVSQKELDEAKNYLISSYNLRFADIINISNMLAYMQKENLGIDFLQKRNQYVSEVTLKQVNQAAARYFTLDNLKIYGLGKKNSD